MIAADFVTIDRARGAVLALRRGVEWAGMVAFKTAGIGAALFGGNVLIHPDTDNKALAVVANMFDVAPSCDGTATDPVAVARFMFFWLLLAGIWATWWSNRKLKAWRAARAERREGAQ